MREDKCFDGRTKLYCMVLWLVPPLRWYRALVRIAEGKVPSADNHPCYLQDAIYRARTIARQALHRIDD